MCVCVCVCARARSCVNAAGTSGAGVANKRLVCDGRGLGTTSCRAARRVCRQGTKAGGHARATRPRYMPRPPLTFIREWHVQARLLTGASSSHASDYMLTPPTVAHRRHWRRQETQRAWRESSPCSYTRLLLHRSAPDVPVACAQPSRVLAKRGGGGKA